MIQRGTAISLRLVLIAHCVLGGTLGALSGERRGDVLLVQRPEQLVILNRYQQFLPLAEARVFLPFTPLVLVREFDLLGDGITPCASVEIGGQSFYLQRESDGEFIRRGDPGLVRRLKDVVFKGDTVVLHKGEALSLRSPDEHAGVGLIPAGSRAVRLFEYQGRTFVFALGVRKAYGWLSLPEGTMGKDWDIIVSRIVHVITVTEARERIQPVVDAANGTLHRIYASLSAKSNLRRLPPQFRIVVDGHELHCGIEPVPRAEAFAGSLRALLPEIDRVLSATGVHPELSDGFIVVQVR